MPPRRDITDLQGMRQRNVDAFMESRGLSWSVVKNEIDALLPTGLQTLITSSPVHGLANSTSDLDFICVTDGKELCEAIAQQFFLAGNHCEVIGFTGEQVKEALALLEAIALLSPHQRIDHFAASQANAAIRSKYLERLVNGVNADGVSSFLTSLQALSRVWLANALHRATKSIALALLAQQSGRLDAALGYAINATLNLMDAVMSAHCETFSNRKWFLLRWRRFENESWLDPVGRAIAEDLSALWTVIRGQMARPGGALPFTRLCTLLERIEVFSDTEVWARTILRTIDGFASSPALPGLEFLYERGGRGLFCERLDAGELALAQIAALRPSQANAWLAASRAGLCKFGWRSE